MLVNAEIRDFDGLNKACWKMVIQIAIYVSTIIAGLLMTIVGTKHSELNVVNLVGLFIFFSGIITFIPMLIYIFWKANKGYKSTWITKPFDFIAVDRYIYYGKHRMHVNVAFQSAEKCIYVHDMDYENPGVVTLYATIKGNDAEAFLDYLQKNDVIIEKEGTSILSDKKGGFVPLSQYRRS